MCTEADCVIPLTQLDFIKDQHVPLQSFDELLPRILGFFARYNYFSAIMPESLPTRLGQVTSLFQHVKPDWWKNAFNEMYLRTDGDCVEDPKITETECDYIVSVASVHKVLNQGPDTPTGDVCETGPQERRQPVQVLDLCCGQGRHAINLSKRYPAAEFRGVDNSKYLLSVAKNRAVVEDIANVSFAQGDARSIPSDNEVFDIVIIMGNSFGYHDDTENEEIMREVSRVLKPGGVVVIDHVDGQWMRDNISQRGWEWIDGKPVGASGAQKKTIKLQERKLLACRERELSEDKRVLANREIVIDLDGSVCQDLFYSVRLYDIDEMEQLLDTCGLEMRHEDGRQISGAEGNGDLGMLESRQLVVAFKPAVETDQSICEINAQDADVYLHPSLVVEQSERMGRMLRVSGPIPAGTVILADVPAAIVPTVEPSHANRLVCSSLLCRRLVSQKDGTRCLNKCTQDVIWCNEICQKADQARHDFECAWLKENADTIRQTEGEYDFTMLWIVIRLLAAQSLEKSGGEGNNTQRRYLWENMFPRGREAIADCLGNRELWPQTKLDHWAGLAQKYMTSY